MWLRRCCAVEADDHPSACGQIFNLATVPRIGECDRGETRFGRRGQDGASPVHFVDDFLDLSSGSIGQGKGLAAARSREARGARNHVHRTRATQGLDAVTSSPAEGEEASARLEWSG